MVQAGEGGAVPVLVLVWAGGQGQFNICMRRAGGWPSTVLPNAGQDGTAHSGAGVFVVFVLFEAGVWWQLNVAGLCNVACGSEQQVGCLLSQCWPGWHRLGGGVVYVWTGGGGSWLLHGDLTSWVAIPMLVRMTQAATAAPRDHILPGTSNTPFMLCCVLLTVVAAEVRGEALCRC